VIFHSSDLLFWAENCRTAQDVGLLTIAVGQRRPVWINQTCTVQRQYLSQTSRRFTGQVCSALWSGCSKTRLTLHPPIGSDRVILAKFIALFEVDALKRDLLFIPQLALAQLVFTSKDDKLKAEQTREGIQKTELPNDQKLVLL